MDRMVAYCGIVCTECPAYIATQTGNRQLLEETARGWSEAFHAEITPESILCDGCLAESDRLCSHCYECEIRACAVARQVENCAFCPDYDCEPLRAFLHHVPQARAVLEEMRAGR